MCGRYTLTASMQAIAETFGVPAKLLRKDGKPGIKRY